MNQSPDAWPALPMAQPRPVREGTSGSFAPEDEQHSGAPLSCTAGSPAAASSIPSSATERPPHNPNSVTRLNQSTEQLCEPGARQNPTHDGWALEGGHQHSNSATTGGAKPSPIAPWLSASPQLRELSNAPELMRMAMLEVAAMIVATAASKGEERSEGGAAMEIPGQPGPAALSDAPPSPPNPSPHASLGAEASSGGTDDAAGGSEEEQTSRHV